MLSARTILAMGLVLLSVSAFAQTETFLLVSSRGSNSVRMYDAATGDYIRDWAPPGIGGLDRPQEVIYGPDGDVYVSGIGTPVILKFDGMTGEYLGPFTTGYQLDSPTKISWGPDGLMYVSQWGQESQQRNVARFDPVSGAFVDEFTKDNPIGACDHVWDDDGNLYLASFGERRVIKYDREGTRLGFFTPPTPVQGPVDLYWAINGDLMVVDWSNGRIDRHDGETGAFKSIFVQGMTNTEGVAFGPDGRLYAADWTENRINAYSPLTGGGGGAFVDQGGGLVNPNSLIFGPQEATTGAQREMPNAIDFRTEPNFPNPFESRTTIPLYLDKPGHVGVDVYDLAGRLVIQNPSQLLAAGEHLVDINASELPAGRYVYVVSSNGNTSGRLITKR